MTVPKKKPMKVMKKPSGGPMIRAPPDLRATHAEIDPIAECIDVPGVSTSTRGNPRSVVRNRVYSKTHEMEKTRGLALGWDWARAHNSARQFAAKHAERWLRATNQEYYIRT